VRPYTANGQNQYTASGSQSFTYDPNGNLRNDGSTAFVYDIENRLVGANGGKDATLARSVPVAIRETRDNAEMSSGTA
jgi:hypothetical protein